MSANEQLIADLKTARDIVAEHWHKGGLEDGQGNYCIVGAVTVATSADVTAPWSARKNDAYFALQTKLPPGVDGRGDLADFNDAPATTHQDVLDLFDKALADLGGLA